MVWKPKPIETAWQTVGKARPADPACNDCGQKPTHSRCVITEQVNWMRGDDEVTMLCIPCAIKRGIKPCNPVCGLLFDKMTQDERTTIAERLR